jgi:hypothetical protein
MKLETQVNCIALVIRPIISGCYSTTDGTKIRIAEIEIADETASIRLRLLNGKNYSEQCDCARENSTLVIRNGFIVASGNSLRIDVERFGSVQQSTVFDI